MPYLEGTLEVPSKGTAFLPSFFLPSLEGKSLELERRFIHPAAREGDQAACAHTTRAPAHPFQRGGVLAYGLRWGMMDSDRAELGLVCGATGWMGLVGGGVCVWSVFSS